MSYTKNTWENGDIITAAKMNNIENGIEAASYDAILYIYHAPNSNEDYAITIQSGSYAALKEKLMNKKPPVILCLVWDELTNVRTATTVTAVYTCPTESDPNNDFVFVAKMPTQNNFGTYTLEWIRITMSWTSADVVTIW